MRIKNILKIFAVILGVLICFSFSNVKATETTSVFGATITRSTMQSLGNTQGLLSAHKTLQRLDSGYKYEGGTKVIWEFVDKDNSSDRYYCLNKDQGFSNSSEAEYNYAAPLNLEDLKKFSTISWDVEKYNKVLWILDNSYIQNDSIDDIYEDSSCIALLEKAGIDTKRYSNIYDLTVEDIIIAQRLAIWYHTNGLNVIGDISGMPENDLVDQITGERVLSRKNKIIKLYNYLINNASATYTREYPTLEIISKEAKIEESDNFYIVGPYELSGNNTGKITQINVTPNKQYTLLNSEKDEVKDNNFKNVIDSEFYIKLDKDEITQSTQIQLDFTYTYDIRTMTFMTNTSESENTQPVVIVKGNETSSDLELTIPVILEEVSVEKVWEDNNNQDNLRPSSVKVQLYKNNVEYGNSITLNKSNNWKYTWGKLLEGYTYTVKEINSSGEEVEHNGKYNNNYTTTYSVSENKTTVTNKHIPETISVSGTKTWDDENNQDGKRPESITVNLLADGKEIAETRVNKENNWKFEFTNLPKYKAGEEIVYTITEDAVDGYTTTIKKYNITNKYIPETVKKTVTKIWNDNSDQDGVRPNSVEVTLYKTVNKEKEEVEKVELNLSNNWEYTWNDLAKYENGEEIKYTVLETVPDKYTPIYSEDTFTITNTYTPDKTSKTVIKEWVDNDNQDGIRPNNVKVQLYANGKVYGEQVELNKENGFKYTWLNLDAKKDGREIVYSVEEVEVPEGYTVEYSEDTFTITNTHIPEVINKTVIKKWEDNNNQDKIRPESIEVQLYKTIDNTKTSMGETYKVVLNKENNWTYTWSGLASKEDGKQVTYSVEEVEVPEGYTVEYSQDTFTITNTHILEVINKTVIKKWEDNNNQDKIRPERVEVQLYKTIEDKKTSMGEEYKAELSNKNNWTYTWLDLDAKENGKQIIYSVEEVEVPEGYTVAYSSEDYSEINEITITNTHIPLEFDLALRKFITKVNDTEYSREPQVDTSKLGTTVNGKVITTATYKHTKEPIAVQRGDIVTYTIRVYNEGEVDGYVEKITDHLPENLLPITVGTEGIDEEKYAEEIEFNNTWGWLNSDDGKSVTTMKTSRVNSETYSMIEGCEEITDTKLEAYVKGSDKLDYIDVQIKCLVTDNAVSGEYLTNIAQISEMCNEDGVEVETDIDSTKINADISNLADYKNEEAINSTTESYIEGQEDDDDFEKLVVKEFDLALRKFITKVNETSHSRVPQVDTSKLGTIVDGKVITTAIYNHTKEPVIVETGDIVTYTIRIYNEGTIAGFANEITDNIPEGLEFMPNSDINVSYNWKMLDEDGNITQDASKAAIIATEYLSDVNRNNIIDAVSEVDGVKTLKYKDVQVQFKVIAKAEKLQDNLIINEAQISADSDRDIDSIPNRNEKYDYVSGNNEDDIDYEPIKLQYFDLALRKFITKVNSVDYNNRYPEIKYNEDGSITYNHTKDPVLVATNDVVVYTLRVYNEGEKAGYATEIIDNLPDGLEFLPENETNKEYKWKMIDSEGNATEDLSKAVKFSTDYLKDELIDALIVKEGSKVLTYKDVKIAFKVVEPNTSDRILVNIAQISEDSDDDIDSVPNNSVETEDDIDKEYVKVQYFDLALKKWVTSSKVTYNGKTTTTKTGFTEDSEGIAKVDLVADKMTKTTVKFAYNIKVTNEGELPGYAYEVKDYIPKGLKFVAEDNKDWKELKDGTVVTDKLKDTLLNPGESATVEIVLTWKNSTTNLGLKTNYAEISSDSAEDIDSTPDNYNKQEDDIDDAQIILSIKTAGAPTYVGLILITVAILAGGTFLIKKYVID